MNIPRLALLSLAFAATTAFGAGTGGSAPVKRFRLPAFNEKGFRTSLVQGDEALLVSSTQIDITELHFTMFAGDETNSLETTLLAPQATIRMPKQGELVASGNGSVRVLRTDLDASGEAWTYDHPQKHLVIRKNVRVVIRGALKDILK